MNIRRIASTLLIGATMMAMQATDFDCKIDFSTGKYSDQTEQQLVGGNVERFGNNVWAQLWEKKKAELKAAFCESFTLNGEKLHLMAGDFAESNFKINIKVITLDSDGEVEAHVLVYKMEEETGEINIYIDDTMSANGAKTSTYTTLSAKGFEKLGQKVALKIQPLHTTKQLDQKKEQLELEKQEKKRAKEEARNAQKIERTKRTITPDQVQFTRSEDDIARAVFIQKVNVELPVEGEHSLVQAFQSLRGIAVSSGANIILITDYKVTDTLISVKGLAYCK